MRQILRVVFGIIGAVLGVVIVLTLFDLGMLSGSAGLGRVLLYVVGALLGFGVFYMSAYPVFGVAQGFLEKRLATMKKMPLSDIVLRTAGLIIGLLIASIVSTPILQLSISRLGNVIGVLLAVVIYVLLGLLGMRLAVMYQEDIVHAAGQLRENLVRQGVTEAEKDAHGKKPFWDKKKKELPAGGVPKILDTSVVIDGRIFEVMKAGFLEGPIVVSHYVLEELQHISDSSDALRRERGRKGLDHVHALQTQAKLEVIIDNSNISEAREVDSKLMILTSRYGGRLVTNDYNLNKVARVQNIPVLNVNDLANALKPVVFPGEHLEVHILKQGKEPGQGLGYLDDGTMIVVENGGSNIGQTLDTVVTSVLQTSAGKMIFTRIMEN